MACILSILNIYVGAASIMIFVKTLACKWVVERKKHGLKNNTHVSQADISWQLQNWFLQTWYYNRTEGLYLALKQDSNPMHTFD